MLPKSKSKSKFSESVLQFTLFTSILGCWGEVTPSINTPERQSLISLKAGRLKQFDSSSISSEVIASNGLVIMNSIFNLCLYCLPRLSHCSPFYTNTTKHSAVCLGVCVWCLVVCRVCKKGVKRRVCVCVYVLLRYVSKFPDLWGELSLVCLISFLLCYQYVI